MHKAPISPNVKVKHPKTMSSTFERKMPPPSDIDEAVYLFVSFDMCKFTEFKKDHPQWPDILEIMRKLVDAARQSAGTWEFWKFNGDEFLMKRRVESLAEIVEHVNAAYRLMGRFSEQLRISGYKQVGLKAGVWIANITNVELSRSSESTDEFDPSIWNYKINIDAHATSNKGIAKNHIEDFVGINLDEGFRMCSHASKDRFLVDPKIAYLFYVFSEEMKQTEPPNDEKRKKYIDIDDATHFLSLCDNIKRKKTFQTRERIVNFANNLVLVGYMECKGLTPKNYPIVWYSDDWEANERNISDDKFVVSMVDDKDKNKDKYKIYDACTSKKIPRRNLKKLDKLFVQKKTNTQTCEAKKRLRKNFYKIMEMIKIDDI